MAWLVTAIVGGIMGLLYGFGIPVERRIHWILNILLGIVGSFLGVWFFFSVLGLSSASVAINFWLLILWSIVGAIILMAIVDAISTASYRSAERREFYRTERGVTHEYEEKKKPKKK